MTTTTTAQPAILANTPAGTQAAMLNSVLAEKHPRHALGSIAARYGITLAELQIILARHGYPDTDRMRRNLQQLRHAAAAYTQDEPGDLDQVDDRGGSTEAGRLRHVAVDDLRPDPNNLREHIAVPYPAETGGGMHTARDDIEELADSIREIGLLQPIVARETTAGLVVVAGHRRLAAIKRLRWTHVDVLVRAPMRPDHVIAAMLIENGQRRDIDPIEEARGIRKLKELEDLTDAAVARRIGRSQSHVSLRLALLNLPAEEQELVRRGQLGSTAAAQQGRLLAGKTRHSPKGHTSVPHFGPTHELATKARARCTRLGHKAKLAGGSACGPCWESVVRADERDQYQARNAHADDCVACGQPLEH